MTVPPLPTPATTPAPPSAGPVVPAPLPYGTAQTAWSPYASWPRRVGARVVDQLLLAVVWVVAMPIAVAMGEPGVDAAGRPVRDLTPASVVVVCVALAAAASLWVWNRGVLEGRSGSSLGKRAVGTRLVRASTGEPLGVGSTLLRDVCHIADGPLLLGCLWPLWDARRQTFADKILDTVVIRRG